MDRRKKTLRLFFALFFPSSDPFQSKTYISLRVQVRTAGVAERPRLRQSEAKYGDRKEAFFYC